MNNIGNHTSHKQPITRCRGSCGSCGEVAGTKDKGSRLDFEKACTTMLERLKIGGITLKSNVYERERRIYIKDRDNV